VTFTDKDYIEPIAFLPLSGDPLFWVHSAPIHPYNLQGISLFSN